MKTFLKTLVAASTLMLPLLAGCNELSHALDNLYKKIDEWIDTRPPVIDRAVLAKPIIEIAGNTVTFDGKPLVFMRPIEEWTAVIGPVFREDPDGPKPGSRTWDTLGLYVLQGRESVKDGRRVASTHQVNSVVQMTLKFNDLPGLEWASQEGDRYSGLPKHKFSGTLVVNGAVFDAKTSVQKLNAQLKRAVRFQQKSATRFTSMPSNSSDPRALYLKIETLPTGYTGLPHDFSISLLN